jgi:ketosteroid isomerase-like protein
MTESERRINADRTAIGAVVRDYFHGLRQSDPEAIARAFHPKAQIMGAPGGEEHFGDRDDFLRFIAETPSPAGAGEREQMSYDVLELTETSAAVRFTVFYLGITVVDLLLLAKHASGWRIVAKVYNRVPEVAP